MMTVRIFTAPPVLNVGDLGGLIGDGSKAIVADEESTRAATAKTVQTSANGDPSLPRPNRLHAELHLHLVAEHGAAPFHCPVPIVGKRSAAKKSEDRKCVSRLELPVEILAVLTSTSTAAPCHDSGSAVMEPRKSVSLPGTFVTKWRIRKLMLECAGSTCQLATTGR
jgi:hypothetical protein